jgi:hypothetical protein
VRGRCHMLMLHNNIAQMLAPVLGVTVRHSLPGPAKTQLVHTRPRLPRPGELETRFFFHYRSIGPVQVQAEGRRL